MIKAAFVSAHDAHPWQRQLPERQNCFDGVEFFIPPGEADIIFIHDDLKPGACIDLNKHIPKICIVSEPPDFVKIYNRYNVTFLSQFDHVLAFNRTTSHPNLILGQTGLPWFVGSMSISKQGGVTFFDRPLSFDDFKTHNPQKTKLVSVVSSNKTAKNTLPKHSYLFKNKPFSRHALSLSMMAQPTRQQRPSHHSASPPPPSTCLRTEGHQPPEMPS